MTAAKKAGSTKKKLASKKPTPQQEAKSDSTSAKRLGELADQSTPLARLVARNPSAPGALLKKLGSHSDSTVRKWVTLHPNTPPKVLAKLATQFPVQLLDNPAFDVLLLENPNLLNEFPVGTRRSLLKREKCPVSFLEWLAQDDDDGVQLALLMNPNTPPHVLRKLSQSGLGKVSRAAKRHINYAPDQTHGWRTLEERLKADLRSEALPRSELKGAAAFLTWLTAHGPVLRQVSPVLSGWARHQLWRSVALCPCVPQSAFALLAEDKELEVRLAVAANPRTPPALLTRLYKEPIKNIQEALAHNPATPQPVLVGLAQGNEDIRCSVAQNESAPEELLRELATDEDYSVRWAVAGNIRTPKSLFRQLAKDVSENVRHAVAGNPSTPGTVLRELAKDRSRAMREVIAKNTATPKPVLRELAESRSLDLRCSVAENASTPAPVLRQLANSKSRAIREVVLDNPSAPSTLLRKFAREDDRILRAAADREAPVSLLHKLAGNGPSLVRMEVAMNPSTPAPVLELLARDEDQEVRLAVVRNTAVPITLLRQLADDEARSVRYDAVQRETTRLSRMTPEELRCAIALREVASSSREIVRKDLTRVFIERFGRSNRASFRRLLCLLLPDCSAPVLARAVRSTDWKERLAVASHPETPEAIRKQLAKDGNEFVRAAAREAITKGA